MYKETIVVIRNEEVIIREEHKITDREMLEILFNVHELINNPIEDNEIVEYQRFNLNGCMIVNQCMGDTVIVTIKKI